MRWSYLVVAGIVLVFGCVSVAGVAVAGSKEDMAAIAKVREMEVAAVNEASADHVAMIYAKGVKYIPPGEPAIEGTDAVRGWLETLIENVDADLEYTHTDVTVEGDWAFEHYAGVVTMTQKVGGASRTENVRGIHIYQRDKEGAWKITHDIWNSDTPHPAE